MGGTPSTNDGSHCLRGIQQSVAKLALLANGRVQLSTEHLSTINRGLKDCVCTLEAAVKAKEALTSASSNPLGTGGKIVSIIHTPPSLLPTQLPTLYMSPCLSYVSVHGFEICIC